MEMASPDSSKNHQSVAFFFNRKEQRGQYMVKAVCVMLSEGR